MDLANHAAGLSLPPDHRFWDAARAAVSGSSMASISSTPSRGSQVSMARSTRRRRMPAPMAWSTVWKRLPITVYAAAHFYHAFDQSGQTEQTTVILTFERGYVTLREWVPTSIEILTPVSAEMLQPYLPGKVEVSTRDDGRTFAYACAPEGKSSLYRCLYSGGDARSRLRGQRSGVHARRDRARAWRACGWR
ncbi:MAG: hypothetical protein U0703_10695 [Anaerolineae bacterium]